MGTLVCLHAHPDDESISTGGSIARAVDEGHRVVLIVATNGDFGEVPEDLAESETLVDRRRIELARSADVLGIQRVVWLGYSDSGMTGWAQNELAESFVRAPLDDAARLVADVLTEESADVLTTYDWHGNYGHPDHIKVHQVGARAAQMAGTPAVFEATMNRDAMRSFFEQAKEMGADVSGPGDGGDFDPDGPADDGNPMGMLESELTHAVDVTAWVGRKRASIACHVSQVSDAGFFMQMPDDQFAAAFGTEWFVKHGDAGPLRAGWLFE